MKQSINTEETATKLLEQVQALVRSDYNIVIFRDVPKVWMLYYMGLHLKKPTIVVLTKDTIKFKKKLKNKLVKNFLEIDDYTEANALLVAEAVKRLITDRSEQECN